MVFPLEFNLKVAGIEMFSMCRMLLQCTPCTLTVWLKAPSFLKVILGSKACPRDHGWLTQAPPNQTLAAFSLAALASVAVSVSAQRSVGGKRIIVLLGR